MIGGKWDELSQYTPITTDINSRLKEIEQDKTFSMFSGLDPEYESVRGQILVSNELPSYSNACAIIQREETRKRVMNPNIRSGSELIKGIENSAFAAKSKKVCSHCQKPGHTQDKCWSLHGKPPKSHLDHDELSCNHCNKRGHTIYRCWDIHGKPALEGKSTAAHIAESRPQECLISVDKLTELLQNIDQMNIASYFELPPPNSGKDIGEEDW